MLRPLGDDNTPTSGQGANTLDRQVIGGKWIVQWTNEDHFLVLIRRSRSPMG